MTSKWILLLLLLLAVLSLCGSSTATDRKAGTAAAVKVPVTGQPNTAISTAAPAITTLLSPAAGEQIKWQVIAGGGNRGTSTNYVVSGTIGQTAAGPGASASYRANHGFWQVFGSGSCCIGTTGNVNTVGIVDLSDLSALVNYLTGGGYVLPCVPEANVNNVGIVDLSDLSALVNFLTGGGYALPACP